MENRGQGGAKGGNPIWKREGFLVGNGFSCLDTAPVILGKAFAKLVSHNLLGCFPPHGSRGDARFPGVGRIVPNVAERSIRAHLHEEKFVLGTLEDDFEFFLDFLALGDVATDSQHSDQFSVFIAVRSLERIQEHFPTIGVADPFLVVPGGPKHQHDLVVFAERVCFGLRVQVVIGAADDLFLAFTHVSGKFGVAAQVHPFQVLEENDVWYGVQQRGDERGLLFGFILRALPGIDIRVGSNSPEWRTVCAALDDLPAGEDPLVGAILAAKAMLMAGNGHLPGKVAVDLPLHVFPVIRVNPVSPGLHVGNNLVRAVAQHLLPLIRVESFPSFQVLFPYPQVGAFERKLPAMPVIQEPFLQHATFFFVGVRHAGTYPGIGSAQATFHPNDPSERGREEGKGTAGIVLRALLKSLQPVKILVGALFSKRTPQLSP